MEASRCSCGNRLFFQNTTCVACQRATGFCPHCHAVCDLIPGEGEAEEALFQCGSCDELLRRCANLAQQVCNACIPAEVSEKADALCKYCQYTKVIPDLSVDGNLVRWQKLERSKRRVLVGMETIGVPLSALQSKLELSFAFKADAEKPVTTGHANGLITINLKEADPVEREKARVAFGEPQRTLVGHFRHELGHYFWDLLIKDDCLAASRALFGDETNPSYGDALLAYYQNGPKADWQSQYVSAYATMHPWEDFAETFGTYLDLRAVLVTSGQFQSDGKPAEDFHEMLSQYQQVGILANEWNRDMGLLDLVPEVFVPPVVEKLHFVHKLLAESADS